MTGGARTVEDQYAIEEGVASSGRRVLHARGRASATWDLFTIASAAGPRSDDDASDHWMVMLGYDAAKAVGEDPGDAVFDVRDEAEARQWLCILARMYFTTPGIS